jgi:hypothetical protein
MSVAAALVPQAPPVEWSKNPKICPSFHEMALALQDVGSERTAKGKKDAKMGKLSRTYKELANLARKLYISLYKEYKDIEGGLESNMNLGKQDILNAVLFKRNHVDVSYCSVDFHQYAINGKVFTLKANDTKLAGLELAIFDFQNMVLGKVNKKAAVRTADDGLRLVSILLEEKHLAQSHA